MMQAAHLVKRDDISFFRSPHWASLRGIFVQAQMSPSSVII